MRFGSCFVSITAEPSPRVVYWKRKVTATIKAKRASKRDCNRAHSQ
jgi:hypothetical protein